MQSVDLQPGGKATNDGSPAKLSNEEHTKLIETRKINQNQNRL